MEKNKKQKATKQSKRKHESEEDDTDISEIFSLRDSDDSMNLIDLIQNDDFDDEDELCTIPKTQKIISLQKKSAFDGADSQQPSTSTSDKEEVSFQIDQFVIVNFEGTKYPGIITDKSSNQYKVSVMEKTSKEWKWPTPPDEIWYTKEEVLFPIQPPRLLKRGIFHVHGLD